MVEHFEDCSDLPCQKRARFPRNLMTGATIRSREGQRTVESRDDAITYFRASLYEDCYLNAYANYDKMKERRQIPPYYKPLMRHLVIDIDRDSFATEEEFQTAVSETLSNIKKDVVGLAGKIDPTVVHTGNGKHIHVALHGWKCAIEDMPEFHQFRDQDLTSKLMRYAERRLSNGKADQCHNPSIKSCLFRVPGTINTKAKAIEGRDPIVRIERGIYPYLTHGLPRGALNSSRLSTKLLNDFYDSLVQEVIDEKADRLERGRMRRLALCGGGYNNNNTGSIEWVDRLLRTAIGDNRKALIFWVLAPYLVTVRRLEDQDKACSILEAWVDACSNVRRLELDRSAFRNRIRECVRIAEKQKRKPIRFETFKEYYPEIYKALIGQRGVGGGQTS